MRRLLMTTAIVLALSACADDKPSSEQAPQAEAAAPAGTPGQITAEPAASSGPPPEQALTSAARPTEIPADSKVVEGCALDSVDGQAVVTTGQVANKENVRLSGWAGDVENGTSPEVIYLQLDGPQALYVRAARGAQRPDVATHFGKPGLADAGWDANVDLSAMPAGTYKVHVIQLVDGGAIACDTVRSVVLQ